MIDTSRGSGGDGASAGTPAAVPAGSAAGKTSRRGAAVKPGAGLHAKAGIPFGVAMGILSVGLVALVLFSLMLGRYHLDVSLILKIIASRVFPVERAWSRTAETILFNIRVPRIIAAVVIGGGLSVCGAAFQGIFQNPLVSPDILGVTSGAGFGAAVAILLGGSAAVIQGSAFAFGIAAVAAAFGVARIYKTTPTLMLVLSGIIVGSIFSALLSLVKYVADPNERLPAIVFWLMGSLARMSRSELLTVVIPIIAGTAGLFLVRWRINLLSLGDDEAAAMGVNTEALKGVVIACGTLVTASAVSACGIIGWVGLVIPHLGRMLIGSNHDRLIPFSFLLGGAYLLLIDDVARSIMSAEIPLGILTAIVGAPFFAWLLRKKGKTGI